MANYKLTRDQWTEVANWIIDGLTYTKSKTCIYQKWGVTVSVFTIKSNKTVKSVISAHKQAQKEKAYNKIQDSIPTAVDGLTNRMIDLDNWRKELVKQRKATKHEGTEYYRISKQIVELDKNYSTLLNQFTKISEIGAPPPENIEKESKDSNIKSILEKLEEKSETNNQSEIDSTKSSLN